MIRWASAIAVGLLLTVGAGLASAATGGRVTPDTGSPGTTVTFENGCLGVVNEPPASVQVAFVVEGGEIAGAPRATAHETARFFYDFVIPRIPSGTYQVRLECAPGNWATNNAEPGGPGSLTVIGTPATDTLPAATHDGRAVVIFLAGLAGGVGAIMFRPRRRSPGR